MNSTGASLYSTESEQFVHSTTSPKQPSDPSRNLLLYGLIAIAVLVAIVVALYSPSPKVKYHCPEFKDLPAKFSTQDITLFKSLKIGIEGVLNNDPTRPSVFLLAYHDIDTAHRLMKEIVLATAHCMNASDPIKLDGKRFVTKEMENDYGVIIDRYQKQLEHNGIMFVEDVNRMPAKAAQVFHTICDTVTPLVERAVIFFTVKLEPNDVNLSVKNVMELVEEELTTNWEDIDLDTLKALIARVTDQVFLLKSEN